MKVRSLFILLFFYSCTHSVTRAIYLIPDNFEGNVILVYNQPTGKKDSIADHAVIYKVPNSGILILQGEQYVQDMAMMKFYYSSLGKINKEICYHNSLDSKKECPGLIWRNYSASFQKTLKDKRYDYVVISVGNKNTEPKDFDPSILW